MSELTYKKSEAMDTFFIFDDEVACPVSLGLVKDLSSKNREAAEFASLMTLAEAKQRGTVFLIDDEGNLVKRHRGGVKVISIDDLTDCDSSGNDLLIGELH